jgi:hypothetical protein
MVGGLAVRSLDCDPIRFFPEMPAAIAIEIATPLTLVNNRRLE